MKKADFLYLLMGASYASFNFGQTFLKNELKAKFKYDIQLNMSLDDPLLTQFDMYPEDNDKEYFELCDKEVVEILCRNEKIPVWIDISVSKANKECTTLNLYCAGRYSGDRKEYYYDERGSGPFGIKSPYLFQKNQ